jgi:hypothetical protein
LLVKNFLYFMEPELLKIRGFHIGRLHTTLLGKQELFYPVTLHNIAEGLNLQP